MRRVRRTFIVSLMSFAAWSSSAAAQNGASEDVVCKEEGTKTSYRLQINWTTETATISEKTGNGAWTKAYEKATVVRNNAQDKKLLAEGTVKQWAGGFGGACARIIDTLFFDVGVKNGQRVGTVYRTPRWVKRAQGSTGQGCTLRAPAPDLQDSVQKITCS
jgi:hypothetical protein